MPNEIPQLTLNKSSPGAPCAAGKNNIFSDPPLSEIGAAHGKSVAQVMLRWLIQRDELAVGGYLAR